MLTKSWWAH